MIPEHLLERAALVGAMDNVRDAKVDIFLWPSLRAKIIEDLEKAIAAEETLRQLTEETIT